MSPSVRRRPGDAVAGKGGTIGARDAATRRHQAPAAASASATTTAASSSPEGAESAQPSPSPWHPLPPSFAKRRRVSAATSASADAASVPASLNMAAKRLTWPPERTPRRGLVPSGGELSSTNPGGLTLEEEDHGCLGSLRSDSGSQAPRALAPRRDAGSNTITSAPPSPTASSAARVPAPRRIGTTTSASANADAASVPASLKRTAARMTWPPERTPRRGLSPSGGGALFSTKPGGPTREEEYLGWLGSLRSDSGPQAPRALAARRDAGANANTRAPPSPTASPAARVPPPRRSGGGINASASSITTSSAAPTATPKGRAQASAASPLGFTPPPPSALAAASRGDRRHAPPPTTKQPAGTRGGAPPPHQTKPTTGTPVDASLLQTNAIAMSSRAPTFPPRLDAFGQRIIEVSFDLNYGHLGYTGAVLIGVYAGLMELQSGWNAILKVSYILLLILGAFGLGTGLMAATSVSPTSHRLSAVCSRLCTCLATFVFIVALACHMGSHGYIAGIVLGVLAVYYMLSVWFEGDPAACGAYTRVWNATKDICVWQWFKWSGQRGPILP